MNAKHWMAGAWAAVAVAAAAVSAGAPAAGPAENHQAGDARVVDLGGGVRLDLVWIPAGEFMMSSPHSEEGRQVAEGQRHRVTFPPGFWLGKYEVTQAQWAQVMGSNPSNVKGAQLPVEQVNWDDCQEFIKALNLKLETRNLKASLPTEAQWEYACRAGTTNRFYTGGTDADLARAGWFADNSGKTTHAVGRKEANAWGLCDMHGNVWEWCQDWYGPYSREVAPDPAGPETGSDRVVRGGSWGDKADVCRSAYRFSYPPGYRVITIGLRVVLRPR